MTDSSNISVSKSMLFWRQQEAASRTKPDQKELATTQNGLNRPVTHIRRSKSFKELPTWSHTPSSDLASGLDSTLDPSWKALQQHSDDLTTNGGQHRQTLSRDRAATQVLCTQMPSSVLPAGSAIKAALPSTPNRERAVTQIDSPAAKKAPTFSPGLKRRFQQLKKRKPSNEGEIEIRRGDQGEKELVRVSPTSPRQIHMSALLPETLRLFDQKAENDMSSCNKFLAEVTLVVKAMQAYVISGEHLMNAKRSQEDTPKILGISSTLASNIPDISSCLQGLLKKERAVLYRALFLDTDLFSEVPQEQELRVNDFKRKMCDFVNLVFTLKRNLDKKNVKMQDQVSAKEIGKDPIIAALSSFHEAHGQRFQKLLSDFNIALQTDEESSKNVFEEVKNFVNSLYILTEVFLKNIEYQSISVVKKGNPYRIYLGQNPYSKNDTCEATHLLSLIPREISQYCDSLKKLRANAVIIAKIVQEQKLPFPNMAANVKNFENLYVVFDEYQKKINGHTSLFMPFRS